MRVGAYGNLIVDTVLTIDGPLTPGASHPCRATERVGGIGNFCRAGRELYQVTAASAVGDDDVGIKACRELKRHGLISVCEVGGDTSTAHVIVDRSSSARTGLVNWGVCTKFETWPHLDVDWRHFMYLDKITIKPETLRAHGNVSVDFCDPDVIPDYMDHLFAVDVLITSQGTKFDAMEAASWTRRGAIVHEPGRILALVDGKRHEYVVQLEHNLNVLGAGDYLSALAIANLLRGRELDLEAIHRGTLDMLQRQS